MSYISAATIGEQVFVWERDEQGRRIERYNTPLEFYYDDPEGTFKNIYGNPVAKKTFDSLMDFYNCRKKCRELAKGGEDFNTYELLVAPEFKVLSKHYYGKEAPVLNISAIDIEVDFKTKVHSGNTIIKVRKKGQSG